MSRPTSPSILPHRGIPDQVPYSSEPPLQSLLPAPCAFIPLLINKLNLDPSYTNELFAFLEVAFFMTDDQKRVELFKLAVEFRTYHALTKYQADCNSIKETLKQVKNSMNHSTTFTPTQKAREHEFFDCCSHVGMQTDIKNACRTVVWDPTRTDYTNPAVSEAALAHLKKNYRTNGFKDHFESPTQARSDALKSQIGTDASYVKGLFKALIREGILGDGDKAPLCLTENVSNGMRKLIHSSDTPNVQHAFHILIVRAFARVNSHLLQDSTKQIDHGSDQEDIPETPVRASNSKTKKRKLTGTAVRGSDFATRLTHFFAEKEDLWGNNISVGGWKVFIDQAIKDEELNHSNDNMPLIPRHPALPALTPITNCPTPAHSSTASLAYLPREFEHGFNGSVGAASPVGSSVIASMAASPGGPYAFQPMLVMPQTIPSGSFFGMAPSHYNPVHSAAGTQDGWNMLG